MSQGSVKHEIGQFYDQVGWQMEGDNYQNARYEDLRPVSAEYIHKAHMRVKRHLAASGDFLLDAGSGPVQYEEYLTYSQDYRYRVCMDLSLVALQEARKRLGDKGFTSTRTLPICLSARTLLTALSRCIQFTTFRSKKKWLSIRACIARSSRVARW